MDDRQIGILNRVIPGYVTSENYSELCFSQDSHLVAALLATPNDGFFDLIREWHEEPKTIKLVYEVTAIPWLKGEVDLDAADFLFSTHLERLSPFAQVDPEIKWYAAMSSAHSRMLDTKYHKFSGPEILRMYSFYKVIFDFSTTWARERRGPDFDAVIALSRNAEYEASGREGNPWEPLVDIYRHGALIKGYKDRNLSLLTEKGPVKLSI